MRDVAARYGSVNTVRVWQTGVCTCVSGWMGTGRVWQTGVCTCM